MSFSSQAIQPPTSTSDPYANASSQPYAPTAGQSDAVSSIRHNPLSAPPNAIQIPIHIECAQDSDLNATFKITTKYADSVTVGEIIKKATQHLNIQHKPLEFDCIGFSGKLFLSGANSPKAAKNPLTDYNESHLTDSGLNLQVVVKKFVHKIDYTPITCKYMLLYHKQHSQYIADKCPFYNRMKNEYNHKMEYLTHLKDFNHFCDEFGDKPPCRYASQCRAFCRLQADGLNFDDLCHIQIYRHPPRQNIINLQPDTNPLIINTKNEQNHPIYVPTENDRKKYQPNEQNGYLQALIEEVIDNGQEQCLHLDDDDEDDDKNEERYSLLTIVDEKLKSLRHKMMHSPLDKAQMLSLILYTGTECNYSLSKSQRNGDYESWKWFDYCLFNAIRQLSNHETAKYKLYSGLDKVKLDKKMVNEGAFKTYVSSAWKLKVARKFVKKGGMIIVMDNEFRKNTYCCDVSWISKFPDECEVLISRSVEGGFRNNFSLKIIEQVMFQTYDIQIVSLYFKDN